MKLFPAVYISALFGFGFAFPLLSDLWDKATVPLQIRGDPLNPYSDKPRLTFKSDGTFKITVFSDLHYGENPWDAWGPEQDFNSTRLMNKVLPDENPDYV